MKKTLLSTLALTLAFSGVSVFADTGDTIIPIAPEISAVANVTENSGTISATSLVRIKAHGAQLIKERINSLQSNLHAITASKTLTTDQKASFTTIVNTNVAGLNSLQASIAAGVDASSTKGLVNSIFTNFRIYGIVIPQIRLEKRINDLQNHSQKLSDTFIKVQANIDTAKGKGKDVTVWQKSLDDAKMLVANDMYSLSNLMVKVTALKPSDYGTTSKSVIASVNTDMKNITKDFSSIVKNVRRPVNMPTSSRKVVGNGTTTPSPLFGTSWVWVSGTANGGAMTVPTGSRFVLSFGEDNHMHSTTDCNTLNGTYTAASGTFSVGPMMSTMMFCEGSQENVYGALLGKATSYTLNGSSLTLVSASGTLTFTKKN